jgi:hypothetical protein
MYTTNKPSKIAAQKTYIVTFAPKYNGTAQAWEVLEVQARNFEQAVDIVGGNTGEQFYCAHKGGRWANCVRMYLSPSYEMHVKPAMSLRAGPLGGLCGGTNASEPAERAKEKQDEHQTTASARKRNLLGRVCCA